MKLINMTCPYCGSTLKIDPTNRSASCEYCGAKLLIDDEVKHVQYDSAEEAGYKFEKGRQRAQAEAEAARTLNRNPKQYQQTPKPPKKRRTWLWILGWIFIFPVPLTILMLRKKDMNPILRGVIIAAGWGIYLLIGSSGNSNTTTTTPPSSPETNEVTEIDQVEDDNRAEVADEAESEKEVQTAEVVEKADEVAATDELTLLQEFYDDFNANGNYDNFKNMVKEHGLYTDGRNNGVGVEYFKVAHTKDLARVISNSDLETAGNYIVIGFDLLKGNSVKSIVFHKDSDDIKPEGDHYDESLKGRGSSESGRGEPDYINVIGYVSPGPSQFYQIEKKDSFENEELWAVPTYEQDKQFWNKTEITLPNKTEVVVREQMLEHEGYGAYSGYLLVERTDDGSQHYIDVLNFITKPYWTYQDNLRTAAMTGDFIAEYNQVSDFYPVFSDGDKLDIPDGTIVLVKGVTGSTRNLDSEETDIEAVVWGEWKYGYGGVSCYFNSKDLTIVY